MKKFILGTLACSLIFGNLLSIAMAEVNNEVRKELLPKTEVNVSLKEKEAVSKGFPDLYPNPNFAVEGLNSTVYGNGMFVIVSDGGIIKTSKDGTNWNNIFSGKNNNLNKVIWTGKMFMAAGDKGTILTSVDGYEWESCDISTEKNIYGVACNESSFIAVGEKGLILTSYDGIKWTNKTSNVEVNLNGVTFGKDKIIVVGDNGAMIVSNNGNDWNNIVLERNESLNAITWNGNMFVAVGGAYKPYMQKAELDKMVAMALPPWSDWIIYSYDGENWIEAMYTPQGGGVYKDVFWNGDRFFVSGGTSSSTSPDGITWRKLYDTYFNSISYNGTKYIGVGLGGEIFISETVMVWEVLERRKERTFSKVKFNGNKYLITGYHKENGYDNKFLALTSEDGSDWTMNDYPSYSEISNLLVCNGNFYGIRGGMFVTSSDGVEWKELCYGMYNTSIIRTDGCFSGIKNVYENGPTKTWLITSNDGKEWTETNIQGYTNLLGLTWTGKYFVAQQLHEYSYFLVSTNGINWERIAFEDGDSYIISGSVINDKVCVVGTTSGKVLVSKDYGEKWFMVDTGLKGSYKMFYDGTRIIGAGENGEMVSSVDGEIWNVNDEDLKNINDLIFDGNKYILVGQKGTILTSEPSNVKYGDLNGDGDVNSTDYMVLKRLVLGIDSSKQFQWKIVGDVYKDGKIDSLDCMTLKRYIMGIIDKIPVYSK